MGDPVGWGGFEPLALEKAYRLPELLAAFDADRLLSGNLCLHGGTALNVFVLDAERLSLDLDLSYVRSAEKEDMLADAAPFVEAVAACARRLGYDVDPGRDGFAGRTVRLRYRSEVSGLPDFVKVDLNFLNRVPLLPASEREANIPGMSFSYLVNDPLELAAGKVRAATERTVPRDLFDICRIAADPERILPRDAGLAHSVLLFYSVLSDRFPNHGLLADPGRHAGRDAEVRENLWPVLRSEDRPTMGDLLAGSMPFLAWCTVPESEAELEYVRKFAGGEYAPELLFPESTYPGVLEAARRHPPALRKLGNVRDALAAGVFDVADLSYGDRGTRAGQTQRHPGSRALRQPGGSPGSAGQSGTGRPSGR